MAQKIHVTLTDDIDGSEAAVTVRFGLDGTNYEIDLSEDHSAALRDALAPFVAAGRKVGRSGRTAKHPATSGDAKAIREWAKANGLDAPERGRIPADLREKFDAR